MMDHQRLVLQHLLDGRKVTQRTAAGEFNCWRLAVVCERLRKKGFDIKTELRKGNNGAYYGVYHL
jgi:hypothetical protein